MELRFYSMRGVELFARVTETINYRYHLIYIVKFCNKVYAIWNNQSILEDSDDVNLSEFEKAAINEIRN